MANFRNGRMTFGTQTVHKGNVKLYHKLRKMFLRHIKTVDLPVRIRVRWFRKQNGTENRHEKIDHLA